MRKNRPGHGTVKPYQTAKEELLSGFEQTYVIELLQRHGFNLHAAAREAGLPMDHMRELVRRHTRPWFLERVRAFYGQKLDGSEAVRVADHLLQLELQAAG